MPCENLDAIVIPKVDEAEHVEYVTSMIDKFSPRPQHVKLLACVESAQSVLNLEKVPHF